MEKQIVETKMKVADLKHGFGNPRKITRKKRQELLDSLNTYGDFGLILIDEEDNVIAGNQRVTVLRDKDPETEVLCKRLVGYTEGELKAINIKDNVHSGEWDIELLADWTADLNIDLGFDLDNADPNDRKIKDMELVHYEKYDYVIIACKNELDYNELTRKLGLEGKKVLVHKKRKMKARAIFYDEMPVEFSDKKF